MLIRASVGSLATLEIYDLKMLAKPTTLYLLQYSKNGCLANCKFCPQAKINNTNKDYVARIPWPPIKLDIIIDKLRNKQQIFSRVCVQSVLKKGFKRELIDILEKIRQAKINLPISIAITPVEDDFLIRLKNLGVDHLGIGLDAASPLLFKKVEKPYSWKTYMDFIDRAVEIFGRGNVVVHLIFGMGESLKDFVNTMKLIYEKGGEIALFAFTPVRKTQLEFLPSPDLYSYRVVQVARYLLSTDIREKQDIKTAFLTSGCPGCNRPFYNESPRKIYNYPSKNLLDDIDLSEKEVNAIVSKALSLLDTI